MRKHLARMLTLLLIVGVSALDTSPAYAADQPDQTQSQAQVESSDRLQPEADALDPLQPQRDAVERLYLGLLDRPSEPGGLEFWVNELQQKVPQEGDNLRTWSANNPPPPLESVVRGFLVSNEFSELLENPSNEEFMAHLYETVLDREPDADGFAFWVNQLETGAISRELAVTGMTESNEFIAKVGGVKFAPGAHWTIAHFPEFVDAGHGVAVPQILLDIRWCESTDNYEAANRRSSARGAYQFLTGSWDWYGHSERYGALFAHHATPAQQDEAALLTWLQDGTRPWNASRHCWG